MSVEHRLKLLERMIERLYDENTQYPRLSFEAWKKELEEALEDE